YSRDRQKGLEKLLLEPARRRGRARMVVAGPQYPAALKWPPNVERIEHVPPVRHRAFYNEQRFTLNLTRARMIEAGYSPSVRLFEAAACGLPIITDYWAGLEEFFKPGREILVADSPEEVLGYLAEISRGRAAPDRGAGARAGPGAAYRGAPGGGAGDLRVGAAQGLAEPFVFQFSR
ncbi:MAG TPA: glycosyltransferase, partial [Candidatus Binatia bacterium]